jgi:uncharacterized Zn finger protein
MGEREREVKGEWAELTSVEVPCERCSKEMALQRVYFADDKLSSIDYKCLSCGHEEIRLLLPAREDTV